MPDPLDAQVLGVRESVAVTRLDHVRRVRFRGDDARTAVDHLCTGALRARDGQLQHVLMLSDEGRCFADAYLMCDDEEYELLIDGPDTGALEAHLAAHVDPALDVEIENRSATHTIIALDGPYAWELVSRVAGADAIGLPYMTFFHGAEWSCYRAGRTGEFGYGLMVPAAQAAELERTLLRVGERVAAVAASLPALDQCALENFFFNMRREGREPVSPVSLQLQWRVASTKQAVGMDAYRAQRAAGISTRVTTLVAEGPIAPGDRVNVGSGDAGHVVNAGWSPAREDWVALALLPIAVAHPGIAGIQVDTRSGTVEARTVAPPVLNNRSLFVSPQLHAYATRHELRMPPLRR